MDVAELVEAKFDLKFNINLETLNSTTESNIGMELSYQFENNNVTNELIVNESTVLGTDSTYMSTTHAITETPEFVVSYL